MSKIIAIKENHLFSKVYAKGKKVSKKNIAVYVLRNFRTKETRLGITVGKKLGSAVQRSRARRLIREAFRLLSKDKTWTHPYLIVVVARAPLMEKNKKMDEVYRNMEDAFSKLSLFSESRIP